MKQHGVREWMLKTRQSSNAAYRFLWSRNRAPQCALGGKAVNRFDCGPSPSTADLSGQRRLSTPNSAAQLYRRPFSLGPASPRSAPGTPHTTAPGFRSRPACCRYRPRPAEVGKRPAAAWGDRGRCVCGGPGLGGLR